jgi:hypothetical protein
MPKHSQKITNNGQKMRKKACCGEIPIVINSEGLLMVFVKDSTKWVHDNCLILTSAKKHDWKGDTSLPISSFPPSPALSTKKHTYDTTMSPPEAQVDHKSRRESRPLLKPAQVEPPTKNQHHITFSSLPDNMFYTKLQ